MKVVAVALLLLALIFVPAAFADSVSFDINVPSTNLAPATSYGTVNLQLIGSQIMVTVSMAPGFYVGSGGAALGFNFGTGVIGSQVSLASSLPSGYSFSCCSGKQMNGFGTFLGIINGSNSSSAVSTLVFTLSTSQIFSGNTAGFTSVFQLVGYSTGGGGEGNQYFAVHVVPTTGNTGFAGTTTIVPESGQYTALISMLICFGGMWVSKSTPLAYRAS